jgi:hypothetical protein
VIRCADASCFATAASVGPEERFDEMTLDHLRSSGWQVAAGAWVCPVHVPSDRIRRRNTHCSNCGDIRGGPFGHEAYECTWRGHE